MDDADRLFVDGRPNPNQFGWLIRSCAGDEPDPQRIAEAAARLHRPAFFVDDACYECQILGAAIHPSGGDLAYVESRAKDVGDHIDISIQIHWTNASGTHESVDIQSYNPFFGCDVRFLEWIDDTAILIYREKHWTFACRFGDIWPPRFVKIEHRWIIQNGVVGFIGYQEEMVRLLTFPALDAIEPISIAEAEKWGLLPPA